MMMMMIMMMWNRSTIFEHDNDDAHSLFDTDGDAIDDADLKPKCFSSSFSEALIST